MDFDFPGGVFPEIVVYKDAVYRKSLLVDGVQEYRKIAASVFVIG